MQNDSTAAPADVTDQGTDAPVLVVDLDGTLCRTDTLHEALFALTTANPMALLSLPGQLGTGKAAFKKHLASLVTLPGGDLPLNEVVVAEIEKARAAGQRVALVSASDERQVQAVADHLGLFDEVFGSNGAVTGDQNLSGEAKARFLTERYGADGFDYIGDAPVDAPVWKAARRAFTVGANPALRRTASAANADAVHLDPPEGSRIATYIKALRPHQWSKNILLFLPIVAAHDFTAFGAALAGFIAFCLTASSVYVINDLVDLQADRAHPRKCSRPFASGAIPIRHGVLMAPLLVVTALALAIAFTTPLFLGALVFYYIVTFAYSLWLKRKLIVDVLTLAGLYTIRIVAGAAATLVPLSPWLLGFSMFLFLSLAAVKRQAELTDQMHSGRQKSAGRAYEIEDLPVLRGIALSAGYSAVLVLALYVSSSDVQRLYNAPEGLWLICPILLYWISRMVMMTHRGRMTDDPIVFAARDRVSQVIGLISGAVVLGASVL